MNCATSITFFPGSHADGTLHTAANVRLWLTNGQLGNRVGPGDIAGFVNAASLTGVRVAPLTAASGRSDGEEVAKEERRFADALLTRGRIVTRPDLETAALAIDRRIGDWGTHHCDLGGWQPGQRVQRFTARER